MSRRHGVNLRSRLLCLVCNGVIPVEAIEGEVITLACGHQRKELLPLKEGRISLEHMRKKIGKECFPVDRSKEATSTLPGWDLKWR